MNCCQRVVRLTPLLLLLLALPRQELSAQKQPPAQPATPAPVLNAVTPLGLTRGTTAEVVLTGNNLAVPTGVYTSFPAKITIPKDDKNGQENTKLRVRIEVLPEASVGYHTIRVTTTRGISNLRLFCIDDLPQVAEVTGNRDKTTPQELPVPCVVNGKVDPEKSTWFQINVKAGDRLSFDVLGRRLGGPIDPQMSIYDAKTKREVAYDNDAPGCQNDPRISHVFKNGGTYLIEVKDVLGRGGADYQFRLRLGDFPLATVPVPMALERGHKATVHFAGPAVAGALPVTVAAPRNPYLTTLWVLPKGTNGLHGWPVALALSDYPELLEQEPNNEPAQANRIPVPGGVTGRFHVTNDIDYYVFTGKKGQELLIEAQTLVLHSPTLVYMVVRNAATKAEIVKTIPDKAPAPPLDQVIKFTPPEDGDYLLEIQHLNYLGGPGEAYHVTILPNMANFELQANIDRFDVSADGYTALPLTLKRTGYTGPVEVSVSGHPGLAGTLTIPAGQNSGVLLLKAARDMPVGPYVLNIVGEATIDKQVVRQLVHVQTSVRQSLGNLLFPPRHLVTQIAIGVRERAPFNLSAELLQDGGVPGMPVKIKVTASRDPGFDEDIVLSAPTGLPPGVKAPPLKPLTKEQNEITVELNLPAKAQAGHFAVMFTGKVKQVSKQLAALGAIGLDVKEITAIAPLVMPVYAKPFELSVAPATIKLAPGDKAKIKVSAIRRGGYAGPIAVELRNLPEKVTATTGTIAMGQSEIELEISAAADAAEGKMDAQAAGTATALNNVANSSPNFSVIIAKK